MLDVDNNIKNSLDPSGKASNIDAIDDNGLKDGMSNDIIGSITSENVSLYLMLIINFFVKYNIYNNNLNYRVQTYMMIKLIKMYRKRVYQWKIQVYSNLL